ncbi:MAG: heat shock protein HslJ [Ulvibacter sp.]|jgi:heat shock protein HslJ
MKSIIILLLALLNLNACNTSKVNESQDVLRLHDIWALQEISFNGLPLELDYNEIKRPVLELHVNDRKIFGNDSCNSIFGSIETLDKSAISFGKIGGTMMACPDMTISSAYTKALQQVRSYKLEGLNLLLFNAEGDEVLKFRKVD